MISEKIRGYLFGNENLCDGVATVESGADATRLGLVGTPRRWKSMTKLVDTSGLEAGAR